MTEARMEVVSAPRCVFDPKEMRLYDDQVSQSSLGFVVVHGNARMPKEGEVFFFVFSQSRFDF